MLETRGIAFEIADHEAIAAWGRTVRPLGLRVNLVLEAEQYVETLEILSPADFEPWQRLQVGSTGVIYRELEGAYAAGMGDVSPDERQLFGTIREALEAIEAEYRERLAEWELPRLGGEGGGSELVEAE